MQSSYDILLDKLDRFIRRYYLNLLIRGTLFFAAGFVILLVVISALEYVGYFTTGIRFFLFYGFLGYNGFILVRFVVIPLLGLARIGRRVGAREAARILGNFFKDEIRDKVTNALELKEYLNHQQEDTSIISAAIDQKAAAATMVPFQKAINLKGNYRFVPFFVVPLLVGGLIYWMIPGFFTSPVERIIRYDTHFEKPAPFSFNLEGSAKGFRNENLTVTLYTEGSVMPAEADIQFENQKYRLERTDKGKFNYTFRNLQQSFRFFILAEGFRFGPFEVEVNQKPSFSHFSVSIQPPAYTRLDNESFVNMGDIAVAEGSLIEWEFNTQGSGDVLFSREEDLIETDKISEAIYKVRAKANESFAYKVVVVHEEAGHGDSLQYVVQVRKDQLPRIQVESVQDTVMIAHLFHRGVIQDDYGFNRLEFAYRVVNNEGQAGNEETSYEKEEIDIDKNILNQSFFHHLDIRTVDVKPGETVEYFYEIFDNDGINGPKSTRSRLFTYYIPSREELLARARQDEEQIKEELSGGIGEVQEAREDLDELRRQMLESDRMNWDQQESVRELLDKQQQIEEKIDQLSEFKERSERQSEQFNETNERIKEKQEELQRIFEEVLSDDLKELFDKIREELDKLDKEQLYDMLGRMEFEFQDMETQMDRALELFKQLEMERMLQESIDKLAEIREEQEELADETATEADDAAMSEKQEELNSDFESMKEMLDEFREKNDELERPHNIDDTSDVEQEIGDDMDEAAENLKRGDKNQAGQKQQEALKKMDELSQRLQGMQEDMFMEQMAEDSRALRQILENLIKSSFAQEELLMEIRQINISDPRYIAFIQEQRKIRDDLSMIEDSLVALSKRQAQIQSFVTREIAEIGLNLEQAIYNMIERQRGQASSRQQFVMTHINNLALLLNESLQNMQMQMAGSGGEGMPQQGQGGSDPSFRNMRQMQEQLNQMLQQMQEGHQGMPGQTGQPQMSTSEAMARMAAEQEAIRKELQKMSDQLGREGYGDMLEDLSELQKEMEQTELDMVRKEVGRQTILRQEQILTRLLEHEQAELQREMEERRVGNTAYNYEFSNPDEIFEYNRIRNRELEMLRSLPAGLKPFYRSLVENYFLNMQE